MSIWLGVRGIRNHLFFAACVIAIVAINQPVVSFAQFTTSDPNQLTYSAGGQGCYLTDSGNWSANPPAQCPYVEASDCEFSDGTPVFGNCTSTLIGHSLINDQQGPNSGCGPVSTTTNSLGNASLCRTCTPRFLAPDAGEFCELPEGATIADCQAGRVFAQLSSGVAAPCTFISPINPYDPESELGCSARSFSSEGGQIQIRNTLPCRIDEDGDGVAGPIGPLTPDDDCDDTDPGIQRGCAMRVGVNLRYAPEYIRQLFAWGIDVENLLSKSVVIGKPEQCSDPDDDYGSMSSVDWNGDGISPMDDPVCRGRFPHPEILPEARPINGTYPLPAKSPAFDGATVECNAIVELDPALAASEQHVALALESRAIPADDWIPMGNRISNLANCTSDFEYLNMNGTSRTETLPETHRACSATFVLDTNSRGREIRCRASVYADGESSRNSDESLRDWEMRLRASGHLAVDESMFVARSSSFLISVDTEVTLNRELIRIREHCASGEWVPLQGAENAPPLVIRIPKIGWQDGNMDRQVSYFEGLADIFGRPSMYRLHLRIRGDALLTPQIPRRISIMNARIHEAPYVLARCDFNTPPLFTLYEFSEFLTGGDIETALLGQDERVLEHLWMDYLGNFLTFDQGLDAHGDRLLVVTDMWGYVEVPRLGLLPLETAGVRIDPERERIRLHLSTRTTGVTQYTSRTISVHMPENTGTLSHEYGHSLKMLCDEYDERTWEEENRGWANGCPNPFPQYCRNQAIDYCPGTRYFTPDLVDMTAGFEDVSNFTSIMAASSERSSPHIYPIINGRANYCALRSSPHNQCQRDWN